MPFRFKKSESPAKAVRRVCRERIGAALGGLRKGGRPAAVHGVRKEIKKLRAHFPARARGNRPGRLSQGREGVARGRGSPGRARATRG